MVDEEKEKVEESKVINEGAVKQFEMDVKQVVDEIKHGMGWIDPEYIEETWNNIASSVDFAIAPEEICNRLIKVGIVYFSDANDEEEKGKQVRNFSEIKRYVSESLTLNENTSEDVLEKAIDSMDEWMPYENAKQHREAQRKFYDALDSEDAIYEKILDMRSVLFVFSDKEALKKIVGDKVNLGSSSPFWKDLATKVIGDDVRW